MKKQILDTPFQDSFEDVLKKDEQVLWRGFSKKNYPLPLKSIALIGLTILVASYLCFVSFSNGRIPYFTILISVCIIYELFFKKIENQKTEYMITNKRVLTKSKDLPEVKIREIALETITQCSITSKQKTRGSIILTTNNAKIIPYEEKTKSPQTTLELIDNVAMVAEIIQSNLKNVN